MKDIIYINRLTGLQETEKVYGGKSLKLLYGDDWISRLVRPSLLSLLVKWPVFSALYGAWQKKSFTKKKILPFIHHFNVDSSEFLHPISHYNSFNDFFIRQLKPNARPVMGNAKTAVMPADGRYYFYQNIKETDGFVVKGEKFTLESLLQDSDLAKEYDEGSMVIVRLCPSDYHRFHFPCDCLPGPTTLIKGWWYSVNPWAIKRDIQIFSKNKRTLCQLQTQEFGKVLYLEIGATSVGSIRQTYQPGLPYAKGEEKGYFEFGASSLILLFPKGSIQFDTDLIEATKKGFEMRCLMGQSMGCSLI